MLEEIQLQQVLPQEIEKRSFEIITEELGNVELDPLQAPIIKRAIHTSADFDYLKNLTFSELAVEQFHTAIKNGAFFFASTGTSGCLRQKIKSTFSCTVVICV